MPTVSWEPSFYELTTILIGLSCICHFIVRRFTRLPLTVGLVVVSAVLAGLIVTVDAIRPEWSVRALAHTFLDRMDFSGFLLNGILSYLIFAASMEIELSVFRERWKTIAVLATVGVGLSTAVFGAMLPFVTVIGGTAALLLGAMQSATDPVSVSALLKTLPSVPETFKVKLAGESLLNDGVAVVVFSTILPFALNAGGAVSVSDAAILFVREAGGGLAVGLLAAAASYWALRAIADDPVLEVLVSIFFVMAAYALSMHLEVSGPLAMVVLGIFMGNQGLRQAVSEEGRPLVRHFWELTDVVMNTLLFTLIGLEILVIPFDARHLWFAGAAILASFVARAVSVILPMLAMRYFSNEKPMRGSIPVLTWGGLRGGILIALALGMPLSVPDRSLLMAGAYGIVLFTVIVQGLTVEPLVRKTMG